MSEERAVVIAFALANGRQRPIAVPLYAVRTLSRLLIEEAEKIAPCH